MWPFGRCAGKLKGPSTASTPRGRCSRARRAPASIGATKRMPCSSVTSTLRREQRGLGARVPERLADLARDQPRELLGALARELAKRRSTRARASKPASRQAGKARRARATAASTSGSPAIAKRPISSAGSAGETLTSHSLTPGLHGSGVTCTRSPARTPSASRHSFETNGAPSSSSGTTVARKPRWPSAESSASGALHRRDRLADQARQHQRAPLAHRRDRVARGAVVGPAVEGIDLVQVAEADLLEDAHAPPSPSRSAARSRPARCSGKSVA